MSDSLRPHELQHAELPCPSLSPRICSNSCPLSWWCHPIILSSVVSFSSCPQSFPALGSFPMSWFLVSGSQSIGASALIIPMNIRGWFPLRLTDLILAIQGTLKNLLQDHGSKPSILWCSPSFMNHISHQYLTTGIIIALNIGTFVGKVMSLSFNIISLS